MTNVAYQCPHGSRLFAAPGGTRRRCPHDNSLYTQIEETPSNMVGFYKDKEGGDFQGSTVEKVPNPIEHGLEQQKTPEQRRAYLQDEYRKLYPAETLDLRWSEKTLLAKIYDKLPDLPPVDKVGDKEGT